MDECTKCLKKFSNKYSCIRHMDSNICTQISFKCNVCEKTYSTKYSLARHSKLHEIETYMTDEEFSQYLKQKKLDIEKILDDVRLMDIKIQRARIEELNQIQGPTRFFIYKRSSKYKKFIKILDSMKLKFNS